MRFLLDTHVILWVFMGDPRIDTIRDILLADENDIFVSAVSWWEIAIKVRIGKLNADMATLHRIAGESGFEELPLLGKHTHILARLPRYHKDPFDHMLLAQAMTEPMHLLSADKILQKYTDLVIPV